MNKVIIPQPNSPAGWQAYASSNAVASVPLQESQDVNETSKIATFRGVFLKSSAVLPHSMSRVNIYANILAFTDQTTIVAPNNNGDILIVSRVLTATGPVTLTVPRGLTTTCAISICTSVLDQPITVATGDNYRRINLDQIGTGKQYSGVVVVFSPTGLQVEHQKNYPSTTIKGSGSATIWASHGWANMSYAPVLVLSRYKETTQNALSAAFAFEYQFERFQDKAESLDIQIQAWNAMLAQAISEYSMRINVRSLALDKYEYSVRTTTGYHQQFENDDFALELLRIAFEMGVSRWAWEQKWKAAFEVLQAVITFAVAVGQLCLGSPGGVGQGAAAGRQAIGAVVAAEKIVGQVGKSLSSGTLQKLLDCIEALGTLYPSVDTVVRTLIRFEQNPNIEIPSTGDISGTSQGDANAAAIVTMAAWDRWLLESDQQMAFAV